MSTAQEHYKTDVQGDHGLWPAYRKPIPFGTAGTAWMWGKFRGPWRWIDRWLRQERYVTRQRDPYTYSDQWDGFPAGHPLDYDKAMELWLWMLERGWSLDFNLLNYTRPALEAVSDKRLGEIMNHPWVTSKSSENDRKRYAAKMCLGLGLGAHDPSLRQFAFDWQGQQLERLAPIKDHPNVRIYPDNEIRYWERVSPFATRKPYDANATFARLLGWEPRDRSVYDELDQQIVANGFNLNLNQQGHAYYGWNGERVTQYITGLVDAEAPVEVNELNATNKIPDGYVANIMRNGMDVAARGVEAVYFYSHAILSRARTVYDRDVAYEQFKSPSNANALLGSTIAPEHEGAAVRNKDVDEAVTALARVITHDGTA